MGITDAGSGTYTAAYTVVEGSADVADGGNVSTSLGFTDAAGNVGATTTTVTLAGEGLDANSPTIASASVADGTHKVGDLVTVTITASDGEAGLTLSSKSFNGQDLTVITDVGSGTYTATYTVVEGSADVADGGNVSTSLGFTDAAGNIGALTTTVTLAGESLDANSPTTASVSVADGTHKVSDVVTVTITASGGETGLILSSKSFNGQDLTGITDAGSGIYTVTYTVVEGSADVA